MNKKILLIGDGGHCKSVLDSLLELNEYVEIGIVSKNDDTGNTVLGIPIVGCDEDLECLYAEGYRFAFVTVGSIGNPSLRISLFNKLCEIGYTLPAIIDSSAKVSTFAKIEPGVFVGKLSIVNAGAVVEKGAIINSGAIVEHDCHIGAFAHIAPGVVLGGEVIIGENSHIGSNTSIKQQVSVGANAIIGMGSVVLKNVQDNIMAYGIPCKEVAQQ